MATVTIIKENNKIIGFRIDFEDPREVMDLARLFEQDGLNGGQKARIWLGASVGCSVYIDQFEKL